MENDFFHKLIQSLACGKDIPYLTLLIAKEISCSVIITDDTGHIIAFHNLTETSLKIKGLLTAIDVIPQGNSTLTAHEGDYQFIEGSFRQEELFWKYWYIEMQSDAVFFGRLIVIPDGGEFTETDRGLIYSASLAILLALKNLRENHDKLEEFQDEFIYDVLYNNYESKASIYDKARMWNWRLQGPLLSVVVDVNKGCLKLARNRVPNLFNKQKPIVAVVNQQIVIILSLDDTSRDKIRSFYGRLFAEYSETLIRIGVNSVRYGIGSPARTVTDLYKSYQEAKVALELGKVFHHDPVCYFEDMGFLKFLFTQPAQELQDFCQRILGSIQAYDLEMKTDLLVTLQTYFNCHCQITECAKALYVHENTLRNRLKKIEQLCGFDIRRIDHLLNIYTALQIYKLNEEVS